MSGVLPVLSDMGPCRDCGACCLHMTTPPFFRIGDPEWERLERERPDLAAEIDEDYKRRRADGWGTDDERPCLWYDTETRRCRHHEYRPAVCADFEPREPACLRHRAARGIAAPPPGSGRRETVRAAILFGKRVAAEAGDALRERGFGMNDRAVRRLAKHFAVQEIERGRRDE